MRDECEEVVMDSWVNSSGDATSLCATVDKIKSYGVELLAWGSSKTAPNTDEKKHLTQKIERINEEELMEESKEEVWQQTKN